MNSLGPKRLLETQTFGKNAVFPVKKTILAYFSRSIEHAKYQGTIYNGPQNSLTFTVKVITPFLRT